MSSIKTPAIAGILRRIPPERSIAIVGIIALGIFLGTSALLAVHPAGGEIAQNTIITAGTFLTVALFALGAMAAVAVGVNQFAKGLKFERIEPAGLLGAGHTKQMNGASIAPDILVCSIAGETPADFAARVEAEKEKATDGRWVVVIPFRSPIAFVYNSTGASHFVRDTPPWQGEEWPEAAKITQAGAMFTAETEAEYFAYLRTFALYFPEYSARAKLAIAQTGKQKQTVFLEMLRAAGVLILMFFALPTFAQTADKVRAGLGHVATEVPKDGAFVTFVFDKREYKRQGDGQTNFIDLLTGVQGYRDKENTGAFLGLIVDGSLKVRVEKNDTNAEGAASLRQEANMRPYSSAIPMQDNGDVFPDSLQLVQQAEKVKQKIGFYNSKLWIAIRPLWGVVAYLFLLLVPILVIIVAIARFVASAAASEGMWNTHRGARRVVFYCVAGAIGFGVADVLLFAAYAETPLVVMVALGGILSWVAAKLTKWATPNFTPAPGNAPRPGIGAGMYRHQLNLPE